MAARRPLPALSSTGPTAASAFTDLGLPGQLVDALAATGVTHPFPIQAMTLPDSLAGRDVLGRGVTGSGKTYAFLLPLVARLAGRPARPRPGRPRALVLAPTRELASQISDALAPLAAATGLTSVTVFGGVPAGPQIGALKRGVDIVVACPGRLWDHLSSGRVDLAGVEVTVLDEADHMADLGFLPVVRRILDRTPRGTQRLLFSATLDAGVDVLVQRYLTDPVVHHATTETAAAPATHRVVRVDAASRLRTLAELAGSPGRVVVFTRTKRGAKKLARQLSVSGVSAVELHGDLSQNVRQRNLRAFSTGTVETLVATDIAARGIHVDDVAMVVHADPPMDHKAYVHRSGRTARAGATGIVVTVALEDQVAGVRALARKAQITPVFDGPMVQPTERASAGDPRDPSSSPERPRDRPRHSAAAFSANRRGR
jgi:superfamily II DNA/RNA helicase